jgi:hypothetical protein
MGSYYVPDGNWTSNVVNGLGNGALNVFDYIPNVDSTSDPALGCSKGFTSNYRCGLSNTPKTVTVAAEAKGQPVHFDCSDEYAKCNNLKLTLTDDGKLTLATLDGKTVLWDSVTSFGAKGSMPANTIIDANFTADIPNDAALTVPIYAGDGIIKPSDVGAGGGNGRRYPYNYLLAGQMLETGQWIGSPSGTCRLIMGGTPDAPNTLQVVKSVLGCSSLDNSFVTDAMSDARSDVSPESTVSQTVTQADETITASAIDTNAVRLYTIPNIHPENVGKAGYVNNLGQLQLYPDSMTAYVSNYDIITGEEGSGYKIAGAALGASFSATDANSCKEICSSGSTANNDSQKCAGFVFDSTTARCQLLDNTLYRQHRIIDANSQFYMRQKHAANQDVSCPTDVTDKNAAFWHDTSANSNMSPTTTCGLANYTAAERTKVAGDLPNLYNNLQYKDQNGNISEAIQYSDISGNDALTSQNQSGFKYWFDTLQNKYKQLTKQIFNTKSALNSTFAELQASRQNLADWTGEQLQNLEAMNEDRDLNMMSQNYRHILWSILAIIVIIATMKITKSVAAKVPT